MVAPACDADGAHGLSKAMSKVAAALQRALSEAGPVEAIDFTNDELRHKVMRRATAGIRERGRARLIAHCRLIAGLLLIVRAERAEQGYAAFGLFTLT